MDDHDDLIARLRRLADAPLSPEADRACRDAMDRAARPRFRRRLTMPKLAVGGIAALMVGSSGLAVAGALPGPAQRAAHEVLSHVGIALPTPDEPADPTDPPTGRGKDIRPERAGGTETDPSRTTGDGSEVGDDPSADDGEPGVVGDTPHTPPSPTTPVPSAVPATPAVPATRATPATPATPGDDGQPATPAEPATPATPATPAGPATPPDHEPHPTGRPEGKGKPTTTTTTTTTTAGDDESGHGSGHGKGKGKGGAPGGG